MSQRQIILDTETTGLSPAEGHRLIEIGCVEMVGRRLTGNNFHYYLQPDREIDFGAQQVHGISAEFLVDKPRFAEVVDDFLAYIKGAELVIHNASFDVGFLDAELQRYQRAWRCIADHCQILDTLTLARSKHRGQKNTLDALCKRYQIDNSKRTLHGALLDAEILAEVYLAMTEEQFSLLLDENAAETADTERNPKDTTLSLSGQTVVLSPSEKEQEAHEQWLQRLRQQGHEVSWD